MAAISGSNDPKEGADLDRRPRLTAPPSNVTVDIVSGGDFLGFIDTTVVPTTTSLGDTTDNDFLGFTDTTVVPMTSSTGDSTDNDIRGFIDTTVVPTTTSLGDTTEDDIRGFIDTTVVPTTTSIGDSTNNVSFYQFGVGDTQNECSDDGSSALIYLLQPFIFFGHTYNQIYVNNNGHLTFDQPWDSYSPYSFPGHGGKDIIAPFWTDLNNCENGVISYQQYTSGDVLTQATQDINQYFPDLSFSASWVFVATWDRVAYFSYSGTETSFQVVLISNGHLSFVLMNYGRIAPSAQYVQVCTL
ncbi:sushi, nidogen and EGF-like domain-containing protein 1 [Paramisgurnus dabryanus]|uniref:sushi, nidogen and EGF-like domain-containing protein 1 n=1 Tax=Paramisgurnus dabryanus TaxID=90735 RepID=UPI003CCFC2BC